MLYQCRIDEPAQLWAQPGPRKGQEIIKHSFGQVIKFLRFLFKNLPLQNLECACLNLNRLPDGVKNFQTRAGPFYLRTAQNLCCILQAWIITTLLNHYCILGDLHLLRHRARRTQPVQRTEVTVWGRYHEGLPRSHRLSRPSRVRRFGAGIQLNDWVRLLHNI